MKTQIEMQQLLLDTGNLQLTNDLRKSFVIYVVICHNGPKAQTLKITVLISLFYIPLINLHIFLDTFCLFSHLIETILTVTVKCTVQRPMCGSCALLRTLLEVGDKVWKFTTDDIQNIWFVQADIRSRIGLSLSFSIPKRIYLEMQLFGWHLKSLSIVAQSIDTQWRFPSVIARYFQEKAK